MIDRERFPVDPWRLIERRYSGEDAGVTETLFSVGNGYLGLRGNHPEGRHAHEHGTFINGFHETWPIHHAEQAYGFAEVGQTIINAPDAKVMRLYVDDEPLSLDVAEMREYERVLDMREGVYRRRLLWRTPGGKDVLIEDERMVSFDERHLTIMRMTVTLMGEDAPVTISSQIVNRQDGESVYGGMPAHVRKAAQGTATFDPRKSEKIAERVLQPQEYWQDGLRSALSYRVTESGMTLAVAADHEIRTDNPYDIRRLVDADIAKHVFRVQAKAGVPIVITKVVTYHTSRGMPARELVDRCRRTLDRVEEQGVEVAFQRQRAWMDDFWSRSDIRIAGQESMQQATRWCLFQLAQAAARADGFGVPAKGVTGSGYSGHYFWDTEIYVLPFLAYTMPLWARNALRMRTMMLPAARRRAAQLNEAGALFPWRTINGEEASAYYAAGTAQYHINADVSYAISKYVRATGDLDFLEREGADVLVETARLWVTLGFWRAYEGIESFHIHGVTGPDEYTTVVNDNLFTNVMARFNLRSAARTVREMAESNPAAFRLLADRVALDPSEPEEWERAGDAMHIPFSENFGIHPQDSLFLEREVWDLEHTPPHQRPLLLHFHPLVIYRFQVLKQADVVLALFLQGNHFTPEEKRADFDYYDPLTTGDSTLSAVVQAIMAAEVGYQDLAHQYFEEALFVDLGDLHHNAADGVHVASAGGVWTALVSGFGGMRDYFGELTFDPRLPVDWPELAYSLQWKGQVLDIVLRRTEMRVSVRPGGSGEPVPFEVREKAFLVTVDQPVVVPLADQGPVVPGRPMLRPVSEMRGPDDRTVDQATPVDIEATLPPITTAIPIIPDTAAVDE